MGAPGVVSPQFNPYDTTQWGMNPYTQKPYTSANNPGVLNPTLLAHGKDQVPVGSNYPGNGPSGQGPNNDSVLAGLIAAMGRTGGGGAPMPTGQGPRPVQMPSFTPKTIDPNSGLGNLPKIADVDNSGAQRAAFARAKDQTGEIGRSALAGLRSSLGGRGMLGGGGESRGVGAIANAGLGALGEVSRQQAIDSSALAERTATTNYQGGIAQRGQDVTQRGQNISANDSANGLAASMSKMGYEGQIAQRGQDIAQQQAQAQLAMEQAKMQQQQQLAVLQGLMGAMGKSGTRVY